MDRPDSCYMSSPDHELIMRFKFPEHLQDSSQRLVICLPLYFSKNIYCLNFQTPILIFMTVSVVEIDD